MNVPRRRRRELSAESLRDAESFVTQFAQSDQFGRPPKAGSRWSPHLELNILVLLVAYVATAIVLSLTLSNDPDGLLLRYAGFLEGFLTSVSAAGASSPFVSAARRTMAVLWTLMPFFAVGFARLPGTIRPDAELLRRRPLYFVGFVLLFLLPLALLLFLPASAWEPSGTRARLFPRFNESRLWFGAVLGVFFGITAMGLGLLPRVVRLARSVLMSRNQG